MSSIDALLGRVISLGQNRYRLEKLLGGGATAVVFLGVNPDRMDEQAAIKIARPEAQWQDALRQEFANLRKLEQAEQRSGTHYFPRVLAPPGDSLQPTWIGAEEYLILAQELVPGIGVHDLTLQYQGLHLPEPLALEIARQYAHMLTILHAAGLTCADRKLADLRWKQDYEIRTGSREELRRFQEAPPGSLMVLDWNVTAEKTAEAVKYDLFRFGLLWYRLLLGEDPRFHRGSEARLKDPLPRHKLWGTLSHPTRQILAKLLHFDPAHRYTQAENLLDDLGKAITLWKMPAEELWMQAENDRLSLEDAFNAADVMRVRTETWGEQPPPNLTRRHNQLRRKIFSAPSDPLREARSLQRWQEARHEAEQIKSVYAYHPAMWLHLDRLALIFGVAARTSASQEMVKPLWEKSEAIFAHDQPDEVETQTSPLDETFVSKLRGEAKDETSVWKEIHKRLWHEAAYRLALYLARQKRDEGHYAEAGRLFQEVLKRRQELGEAVCERLDMLYSDPTPEAEEIEHILSGAENLIETVRESLGRLGGDDSLEAWRQTLWQIQSARHDHPADPVLDALRGLVEAEETWRQSKARKDPPLELIPHLKRLYDRWEALQGHLSAEEKTRLADAREAFQERLDNRRNDLRARITGMDSLPVLETYRRAFPNDTEIQNSLEKKLENLEKELQQSLPLEEPTTLPDLQKQVEFLSQLYPQAENGVRLAKLIGQPWPEALKPEKIAEQREKYTKRWQEVAYYLERY
ncbi:MAG: hypothetical protein D6784_17865 [Chloroflexi bacterium]|nr:MAG: hypothetical protein D6784_17865 [Chloroflexota bacterium]